MVTNHDPRILGAMSDLFSEITDFALAMREDPELSDVDVNLVTQELGLAAERVTMAKTLVSPSRPVPMAKGVGS